MGIIHSCPICDDITTNKPIVIINRNDNKTYNFPARTLTHFLTKHSEYDYIPPDIFIDLIMENDVEKIIPLNEKEYFHAKANAEKVGYLTSDILNALSTKKKLKSQKFLLPFQQLMLMQPRRYDQIPHRFVEKIEAIVAATQEAGLNLKVRRCVVGHQESTSIVQELSTFAFNDFANGQRASISELPDAYFSGRAKGFCVKEGALYGIGNGVRAEEDSNNYHRYIHTLYFFNNAGKLRGSLSGRNKEFITAVCAHYPYVFTAHHDKLRVWGIEENNEEQLGFKELQCFDTKRNEKITGLQLMEDVLIVQERYSDLFFFPCKNGNIMPRKERARINGKLPCYRSRDEYFFIGCRSSKAAHVVKCSGGEFFSACVPKTEKLSTAAYEKIKTVLLKGRYLIVYSTQARFINGEIWPSKIIAKFDLAKDDFNNGQAFEIDIPNLEKLDNLFGYDDVLLTSYDNPQARKENRPGGSIDNSLYSVIEQNNKLTLKHKKDFISEGVPQCIDNRIGYFRRNGENTGLKLFGLK